jgi:NADH-quinone oxidoreductase subunit G
MESWLTLDDVLQSMTEEIPALALAAQAAPNAHEVGKIAREPQRYSGRTSMLANISVHEPKPPSDADSPLAFSMESDPRPTPPSLIPFFWDPGWNSIQATNKYQSEIGGPLRGGDPGVRLIEPKSDAGWQYATPVASQVRAEPGACQVIPYFHLFGSEELSRHSPGICELSPQPYIALNPIDASALGVQNGEPVRISVGNYSVTLPVVLRPDLAAGLAAIPAGVSAVEGLTHSLCDGVPANLSHASTAMSSKGEAW